MCVEPYCGSLWGDQFSFGGFRLELKVTSRKREVVLRAASHTQSSSSSSWHHHMCYVCLDTLFTCRTPAHPCAPSVYKNTHRNDSLFIFLLFHVSAFTHLLTWQCNVKTTSKSTQKRSQMAWKDRWRIHSKGGILNI